MSKALVLVVTVLTYALLYAPQPLLPLLAHRYGVSGPVAALLITATLVPLSVAPLSYGALLRRVSPVRVLRAGVLGLAATEAAFALADRFPLLLGLRLLQGLLLPAVMTSLMTYVALAAPPERRGRELSHFVAMSILGGYLGRLLAGLGAAYVGWRWVFAGLAVALALTLAPLARLRLAGWAPPEEPTPRLAREVLRAPGLARVYALVFALFFVFAALLNFLPFRLVEIAPGRAEVWSGLVYTGYLFGMVTALSSRWLAARLGGEPRALVVGFAVYAVALASTAAASPWTLFAALFAFCGAMFLMHALATGLVNREAGERSGTVNGLYLAFYYSGGVLGSFVPGLVYDRFGWGAFVGVLLGVTAVGWALAVSLLPRRVGAAAS